MAFKTPKSTGAKDAKKFLKDNESVSEIDFTRRGVKLSENYTGVVSPEEYLRGWLSAWKETKCD